MQLDSHKVPFFNKTADLKAGLNQLGLRNASEVLYTSLLPGLNNVSNRTRYYSFYCWLIGEFYINRESFAENGGYPPTQNGDIRSLLVPLNRRGTGTKVPIFTLSMIVVLKPFRFFGDDKLYIYNAGDIVKHSWSDCRQMPLTTDQASGVVWKFVVCR